MPHQGDIKFVLQEIEIPLSGSWRDDVTEYNSPFKVNEIFF